MSDSPTYQVRHYQLLQQLTDDEITTFKAQDTKKNQAVLIKFFLPRKPHNKEFLARFEETAAGLVKLEHPNLEPVLDYGFQEGVPYLVTPFPRQILADKMGKPLGWMQAARLLAPLAKALAYLHQNRISHQNITPENIHITRSGPLLSGIGLVKILEMEGSTNLTGTGAGLLSPEYLSPEQWAGKALPQSDVYSLGILFFQLLTGKKPYTSDTRQGLKYQHSSAEIPLAGKTVSDIPKAVDLVLHKALAKDPKNRFKNMQEFAQALEILGWNGSSEDLKKLLAAGPQNKKTTPPPQALEEPQKKQDQKKKKTSSRKGITLILTLIFLALTATAIFFLPDILNPAAQATQTADLSDFTDTPAVQPSEVQNRSSSGKQHREHRFFLRCPHKRSRKKKRLNPTNTPLPSSGTLKNR